MGLVGLQCCNQLIQCEVWWVATDEQQAYGRLLRPIQNHQVTVHYMLAEDSLIDIRMEEARDAKPATNLEIVEPLRRKDDEGPITPIIITPLKYNRDLADEFALA